MILLHLLPPPPLLLSPSPAFSLPPPSLPPISLLCEQATSKVFIRDSSMVTPYALVLFGTDLRILHAAGHVYVDDWIKFRAPARLSVFLKYLRRLLQEALDDKLRNPEADISDHPAVSLLLDFLEFE